MNQPKFIPFNKPYVAPNAMKYVKEALNSEHQQGGGVFTKEAAALIKKINSCGEVFLTSSCTQALEMATILLDLKPGDEVIMPSYTFTSAAISLVNFGITPVFVDVEPNQLNIDPDEIRKVVTPKTKAISVVNYAGSSCDFDALDQIANEFKLLKIEDNAHGFGVISNNFNLGTWGDIATLSFHATKNIQCGEGGALIVNNKSLIERAFILQEKGTNRRKFLNGEINKYRWIDKGGSYLLNEITAAFLTSQLNEFDSIQKYRFEVVSNYFQKIKELEIQNKIKILGSKMQPSSAAHMFAFLLNKVDRNTYIEYMHAHGIQVTSHYQCLHNSHAGIKLGLSKGTFRNSIEASEQLVRLPLWFGIDEATIDKVVTRTLKFFS